MAIKSERVACSLIRNAEREIALYGQVLGEKDGAALA